MMNKYKKNHYLCGMALALSASTLSFAAVANNTFTYNPKTLTWTATNAQGQVVASGHGSGGRNYCADVHHKCRTPVGTFAVMSIGGADCRSSKFPLGRGGAHTPYCMFFKPNYAIHGYSDVPNYNASHGCLRVSVKDAYWLSHHFMHVGTRVRIEPY